MVQTTADVSGLLFLYLFSVAAAQAAIQEQITVATTAIAVASAERKIWQGRLCGLVLF